METDSEPAVSAVQCSVIQYCSEPVQSTQVPEQHDSCSAAKTSLPDPDTVLNTPPILVNQEATEISRIIESKAHIITIDDETDETNGQKNNIEVLEIEDDNDEKNDVFKVEIPTNIPKTEIEEIHCNSATSLISIKNEEEVMEAESDVVKTVIKEEATGELPCSSKQRGRRKDNLVLNGVLEDEPYVVEEILQPEEESVESESDEEIESKPRRRGRCKKNPELVPAHLLPDIALGYKMLLKFMETPQFAVFQRPGFLNLPPSDVPKPECITCLNQIRKKFDENTYARFSEFVTDVRALLTFVYELAPRGSDFVKRALRLEQLLEQRITQLPNYLRPQCSLILTTDETSNSPQKIRINKGGGFVSLLQERAEKLRVEKDREKRKVLAEERKQLKEEQDKDVQEWEKNVLLKEHEDDIKTMWELPQIGHFIHLCANILNIGDVSQYEVERMLLMPQCSDTLDLIVTALLSNSLMRAKLDRVPSMPYSIWSPLVRTRVNSWYRALQREFGNRQKVFEEIGVEPEFFDAVGSEHSPLDHFFFHDIPFFQRVWILKTLCDVDFVRKKTVHDNIRQQVLEELAGTPLGTDRHGNRYIHFQQFGMTALRIYKQSPMLEDGITPGNLIECTEGFEERSGLITQDKIFKDIWDISTKPETPKKKIKGRRRVKQQDTAVRIKVNIEPPKSIRQSARAKRKVYVDSTDSEGSDTDLATLKNKLADSQSKADKTFISLTVFRLPRDKVKVNKKSYYAKKLEREERLKAESELKDSHPSGLDEEASESMDMKMEDDDDDETKDNFTVKNLENLKMVLTKGNEDTDNATDASLQDENKLRYVTPAHLLPDKTKFYLVVDSVEGLRQLISQFSSDENDLEIVNRSRSTRKSGSKPIEPPSCEVLLIGRLQKLLEELESWEMDFIKTSRSIRDKLFKEHVNFTNRLDDFVHPNEAYWLKVYEEPPPPPPVEPEPPPVELPPPEPDASIANPPSPLGGLRPRTRTRQMQQKQNISMNLNNMEQELDEEIDEEMYESSESDDNWELPSKKRRKSGAADSPRTPPKAVRQSKRQPKKKEWGSSPGSADGDSSSRSSSTDRAKNVLFWSARSSDPSEDLNWEKNRQKILEKHNSPQKSGGDNDNNKMQRSKAAVPRLRVPAPPIPGNRKPYFSAAQLKAMKHKDPDIEIIGASRPQLGPQVYPARSPKRPRPTARPVLKKSAGTQSNEIIELDGDIMEVLPPTPRQRPQQQRPKQARVTRPVADEQHEYYLTDATSLYQVDGKFVQDMINNDQLLRQSFGDKLDLSKPVHVIKKKPDGLPITINASQQGSPKMQQTILVPGKPNDSTVIKLLASSSVPTPEAPKPTGLRFIRPQNVPPNEMAFMKPTQVTATRPAGTRMVTPVSQTQSQPSIVYLHQTQGQGLIQLPAGMRGTEIVQLVAQQNTVAGQNPTNTGDGGQITIFTSASSPAQFGYIQVQAAGKQQPQLVQASHGKTQMTSTVQTTPALSANNQNVVRIVSTTSGQTQSFVRLATTGSQINFVQMAGNQNPGFRQQVASVSTVGTSSIGTSTQANSVELVQVLPSSNLPGEGISYVQLRPGGNMVQLQATPPKSQQQVQAASPRQQTPVGRLVQVQASQQTPGLTPTSPGTKLIQMVAQQRPQTNVFQTYGSPRMVQMQTTGRPAGQITRAQQPQLIQVQAPVQGSPRLQVALEGSSIRQQAPGGQILRPQGAVQQQGTTVLQMHTTMAGGQGICRPHGTNVTTMAQNIRQQVAQILNSSSKPTGSQLQGPPRPTLVRIQTPPRQVIPGNAARTSATNVVTSIPMSVVTSMPLSQASVQAQSQLRPVGTVTQRLTAPGSMLQMSLANKVHANSVQVQTSTANPATENVMQVQTSVLNSQLGNNLRLSASSIPNVSVPSLVQVQSSMPNVSVPSLVHVQTSMPHSSASNVVQATMSNISQSNMVQMQTSMSNTSQPTMVQFQTSASGASQSNMIQMQSSLANVQTSSSGHMTVVSSPMQVPVMQNSGASQKVGTQIISSPKTFGLQMVQANTNSPRPVNIQMLQAGANSQKPVGIQMVQVQADGTLKPYVPQFASQSVNNAANKPMTAQIVQVPAGTQLGSTTRQITTQIVQMPMAGGKTGFFQIEGVPGQPMTIVPVQVVTSSQPNTPTTNTAKTTLPSVVQFQSPTIASPNFIQVASPSPSKGMTVVGQNSTGLPQNSLSGGVQTVNTQFAARPRKAQPRAAGATTLLNKSQDNTVRLISSGLRLVKPANSSAAQQSIVRTSAPRMQLSGNNRVVSVQQQQQPTLIKLDEEDDEIRVVGGATETVDILHGELSAKDTPEGWRYSVKTSLGKDRVLTNEEVERRRAANNGRMF